jgi:hypothetical protein
MGIFSNIFGSKPAEPKNETKKPSAKKSTVKKQPASKEGKTRGNIKQPSSTKTKKPAPKVPNVDRELLNTEKVLATSRGEPWIAVVSVDIDPANPTNGSFEFDWNDIFIAKLIKAGYQKSPSQTDADIVNNWYMAVCRNVLSEYYEQAMADPAQRAAFINPDLGKE